MGRVNLDAISDDRKFQDLALLFDSNLFQKEYLSILEEVHSFSPKGNALDDYTRGSFEMSFIYKFLSKIHYPKSFANAVLHGIKHGCVDDTHVEDLYRNIHVMHMYIDDHPYYADKNEVLISIYPATIRDRKQKIIKELGSTLSKELALFKGLPNNHPLSRSDIKTIRIQRDLYWLNKKKGYARIATDNELIKESVVSSIKAYKALLDWCVD